MFIALVALAAGSVSTLSQVAQTRPSMLLFWGGIAVAILAACRLTEGEPS